MDFYVDGLKEKLNIKWDRILTQQPRKYKCGFCGSNVSSEKGLFGKNKKYKNKIAYIYICPECTQPTYFNNKTNEQIPGSSFGEEVKRIDDKKLLELYNETRNAYSANSYTLVVLSCRKILMHIAVSKGANEGESFVSYVNYLSDNNYISKDSKQWVDHIREKGNEANHTINIMKKRMPNCFFHLSKCFLK